MECYNYTDFRNNLKKAFDSAIQNHERILITRKKASENMVVLSEADYNSLQETAYLLQHPENASRLAQSLEESRNLESLKKVSLKKLKGMEA